MSTYTLHIDESSSRAKALLNYIKDFAKLESSVEIETEQSTYNSEFIDKIKESEKEIEQGKVTRLESDNDIEKAVWG